MKFLLIVLAIHLLIEWIARRRDHGTVEESPPQRSERVIHPAEFMTRDL
jgi:hypothetical protein